MIFTPRFFIAGLTLLVSVSASAGITLGGTRVVYLEKNKEVSLMVRNDGAQDIMIQSWMEPTEANKGQDVPFALTPSLSRLAGNKQQILRLFYYGKGLPADKESVFWLSVQEIPQKSEADNTLQIAVRQRIKVFYRPAALTGTQAEAVKNLKWKMTNVQGKPAVKVTNDSLFHVSFGTSRLLQAGKYFQIETHMLLPQSSGTFALLGNPSISPATQSSVEFNTINDYGAVDSTSAVVVPQ